MKTSPTITLLAAALVKAQAEMSNAKKDSINPFFKSKYADLNSVREATIPFLNKHDITAIQPTCVIEDKNYVETVLLHASGEYIASYTEIITSKVNDAQSHGSGLSYARRYALQSICNIGADDDDGNAAVKPQAAPKVEVATQAQIDAAVKLLNSSKTYADLAMHYAALPETLKRATILTKDALKTKFATTSPVSKP